VGCGLYEINSVKQKFLALTQADPTPSHPAHGSIWGGKNGKNDANSNIMIKG